MVTTLDGESLFVRADAAVAAIDALVAAAVLVEEAAEDHDARTHFASGAEIADTLRQRPPRDEAATRAIAGPCVVLERCRIRRLRRVA